MNVSPSNTPQFYDATLVVEEEPSEPEVVKWIGFPKQLRLKHPNNEVRWKEADSSREVQNEYLEWSVQRNNQNKITRIVFCTEGPEYFHFLAQHQRDTLLDLYQQFNPGVSIQEADLFTDSKYNPKNKWNSSTTGSIAHIVECPNTFYSLADLARRATVVRSREDGTVMTNSHELGLGTGTSNSDPAIGIVCNDLVRGQARQLTLADPIGLYIHSVEWGMVDPPTGHEDDNPEEFWKWTRGSEDYVGHYYMRGEFEVPADRGYVVGDLLVNGVPLNYGAQLADFVFVSISVQTSRGNAAEPRPLGSPPAPGLNTCRKPE